MQQEKLFYEDIDEAQRLQLLDWECGYADPVPVDPEDEAAELKKEFIQSVAVLDKLRRRMEKLEASSTTGNLKPVA